MKRKEDLQKEEKGIFQNGKLRQREKLTSASSTSNSSQFQIQVEAAVRIPKKPPLLFFVGCVACLYMN